MKKKSLDADRNQVINEKDQAGINQAIAGDKQEDPKVSKSLKSVQAVASKAQQLARSRSASLETALQPDRKGEVDHQSVLKLAGGSKKTKYVEDAAA
ncbi:MAG: hypothetical protein AAB426_10775, partial [Myxococcota bacterium]